MDRDSTMLVHNISVLDNVQQVCVLDRLGTEFVHNANVLDRIRTVLLSSVSVLHKIST